MASNLGFDGGLTLSFQCADRARSIAWFRDVLGFELLYDVDDLGWCELATAVPGVNVGLSEVEEPKVGHGPVPTFGVKDIEAARSLMESRSVRFDGETRSIPDMVKLATFYDPDGNALMLYQDLQQKH